MSPPRTSRIIEISAKGSRRSLPILLPYHNLLPLHPILMAGCFLHHHRAFSIMTQNDETRGKDLQSRSNPVIAQLITWNKTHCASLLLWEKMMKHKPSSHHSAVWLKSEKKKKKKRHTAWQLKKKILDCVTEIVLFSVFHNRPFLGLSLYPHLWNCQSWEKWRDTTLFDNKSRSWQAVTAVTFQKAHACSALHVDCSFQQLVIKLLIAFPILQKIQW